MKFLIVDTEVKIAWVINYRERYEKLGYKFTDWHQYFTIPISHLHQNSSVEVNVQCDHCQRKNKVPYRTLFLSRAFSYNGYGSYLCYGCVFKAIPEANKKKKQISERSKERYIKWHDEVNIKIPNEHLIIDLHVENNYTIIPNVSGIYRFYDETNRLLYVGKAKDLGARVSQHVNGKSNTVKYHKSFKRVSCSYVKYENTEDVEKYIINELKPTYNKSLVYTYETTQ